MIILFWTIWVILVAASFVALRSMLLQEKQHSQREAKLNAQPGQLEKDLISKDKAIEKLENKTENNKKNIEIVFQYIDELNDKKENPKPLPKEKPIKQIGYKLPKKK